MFSDVLTYVSVLTHVQDLRRSNFTSADCRKANFKGANLQGAYFSKLLEVLCCKRGGSSHVVCDGCIRRNPATRCYDAVEIVVGVL